MVAADVGVCVSRVSITAWCCSRDRRASADGRLAGSWIGRGVNRAQTTLTEIEEFERELA